MLLITSKTPYKVKATPIYLAMFTNINFLSPSVVC